MFLFFVDLELNKSKNITQAPEQVAREFSSLPFISDIHIYINLCNPFLLGFKMFTLECTVFVCS